MAQPSDNPPPDENPGNPVDPDRIKDSMSRLMDIYADISDTAARQGLGRCPYKDASARCTAKFPCRNQFFKVVGEKAICTGSDDIDYRLAWQT